MAAHRDTVDLKAALLQWIQAFAPEVESLFDLRDGHALFDLLNDIDSDYFANTPLPAPTKQETANNWIPRWQNLKHIQKIVAAYVRDVCGVIDTHAERAATVRDGPLKTLAVQTPPRTRDRFDHRGHNHGHGHDHDHDSGDTDSNDSACSDPDAAMLVVIKGILRAAMFSPVSNERMGRIVLGLGPEPAKAIASALTAMEEDDADRPEETSERDPHRTSPAPHPMYTPSDDARQDPFATHDTGLEHEGRLIKAHRIIRQLEATNARVSIELNDLRKEKTDLQEALELFKYNVDNNGSRQLDSLAVKSLKASAKTDRDHISDLENDLSNTKAALQTHERQLERLTADADSKQHLRDEVQLLKAERDELAQKARSEDNLKRKIQLLQEQERRNATVREDLHAAQEQLQAFDALKDRCERLQKSNAENLNIIANTEQEIFDQKTSKKRLEHEFKVSMQKFEAARADRAKDQETIAELERKMSLLEANPRSTPSPDIDGGLDSELRVAEQTRRSASRAENRDISAEVESRVEKRLTAINARNKRLESEYLGVLQDKLGLETIVQELRGASPTSLDANPPFLEQRKRLDLAQQEINMLKDVKYSLTAELASVKEKLITANTPTIALSRRGSKFDEASDADSIATHESLIDAKAEYQALYKSYVELTQHSEDIETQLAQQHSLVRHALLNHKTALVEPAETRKTNEYKLVMEQLHNLANAATSADDLATYLVDKIETARMAVTESKSQISSRDQTIASLRQDLQTATSSRDRSGQGLENDKLRRELKLMASAWGDVNTRIHTADVTLARRGREEPKSYLMKQRDAIGLRGAGFGASAG